MSIAIKLTLLFLFIFLFIKIVYMKAATKKKIIFLGDSITEYGMGSNGYVTLIKNHLHDNAIEGVQLIGAGISGNTVKDGRNRLENDVLLKEPFATVVFIGINDVWNNANASERQFIEQFKNDYRYIIQQLQLHGSKVLLCTPTVIGEKQHGFNERDAEIDMYTDIVKKIAQEFNVPLVDLRKMFMDYYSSNNPNNIASNILTTDGVHLNRKGNALVAESIWNALAGDATINVQLGQ